MNYQLDKNNKQVLTTALAPKSNEVKLKIPKGGKKITFSGYENHDIPLELASKWTKNFRTANTAPDTIKAHFFGKEAIMQILEQEDCVGARIYNAIDETGKKHLIVVGAREDGSDIYNGLLAERSFNCPPFCGGGVFKNGVEINPLLFS